MNKKTLAFGVVATILLSAPVLILLGGMGLAFLLFGGGTTSSSASYTVYSAAYDSGQVPQEYRAAVLEAGAICDEVGPAVIAAQIQKESNWNPDAVSFAGATGISQFMPATWDSVGRDGDGDGVADIHNAYDQIYSQGVYMCSLAASIEDYLALGLVQGDPLELTLASYNAGLGAVKSAGGIPNNIETPNYVETIVSWARTNFAGVASGITASDSGAAIVEDAEQYLGVPYVWGGTNPAFGLDCSGLVQRVFLDLGVSLPRTADQMANMSIGEPVEASLSAMQPGDIVAFWNDSGQYYSHVSIYAGNGQIIHAPRPGRTVTYADISYWPASTWKVRRVTVETGQ